MSENKQRNIGGVLIALGIICAAILTLVDYKIKNDLIRAAMDLDRKIREYRGTIETDIVDNSDDSVRGDIPIHTENHHDSKMEMGVSIDEVPESPEVRIHGQARDSRGRFQTKDE